ncbi:MAG: hypothetical protein PWQ18_1188, partial [Clostridia bacterium]|nr:hypothetical protein [Clostridia bacterium]
MGLALSEIAAAAGKKCTYTDYHQLPEGAPYQLIGGELIMTPAPTTRHQKISIKLATKMYAWVEAKNLGQVLYAPV